MFKYLGQHIFDFVSKFRNDVYFQNLEELDQNFSIVVGPDGKLSKSKSPAEKSIIEVRNDEGSVIPAGAPLYSKGEIGGSDRIKVGICDASDPAKMPCIGIAQAEMNTSDTKDNFAITQGVYNTNISGFTGLSEGDTLYVNGGSAPYLVSTKPSNGNYIQNVGIVLKTNGTICQGLLVSAIGRTNDVPWPLYVDVPNSRVGIGTTSPSWKLDLNGGTENVLASFSSTDQTAQLRIVDGSNIPFFFGVIGTGAYITPTGATPADGISIKDTGNVGIGIASPTSRLEVLTSTNEEGITLKDVSANLKYKVRQFNGNTYSSFWNASNSETVRIASAGNTYFNGGNVGIGTTSPSEKLHVVGNIKIEDLNPTIKLLDTNGADWDIELEDNHLRFKVGSTEYVRFQNGGNVGIGTNSPGTELHVSAGDAIITAEGSNASYINGAIQLISNHASSLRGLGTFYYIAHTDVEWFAGLPYNNNDAFVINRNTNYTTPSSQTVPPGKGASQGRLLTLDSTGRLGIGTSVPAAELDVNGSIKLSADSSIFSDGSITIGIDYNNNQTDRVFKVVANDTTEVFRVQENGNVGIGTTSPSQKLEVNGNIKATKLLLNTTNNGYTLYSNGESRINGVISQQTNGIDYLQKASGTGAFYVRNSVSGQRILVGAANSSGQFTNYLEVDGANNDATIRTNDLDRLYISSSGNIGIGTTSPSEKLEVSGNIKASGTIKGKMEQMFACSFSDDLGTTKHYLSFTSNAEQTNVHADQAAMVMPYNGRVKSIQMRLSNIDADTIRTFGIETIAPGINMYAASNNWTIEETESYELAATDDFYLVNYVFSNTSHFESGDLLAISIQDAEDAYTASRQTYVNVIIEYDLNNGMGNDTATTKYTS